MKSDLSKVKVGDKQIADKFGVDVKLLKIKK